MYDRILVPTDGSAGMEGVVTHANSLAKTHDGEIHGLYVVDTGRFSTLPAESTWEGVTEMLREEGDMALEAFERIVDEDVAVTQAIVEGSPSKKIVEYARDNGIDIIVMGTHGRGGIDRLLLGSVAERVVRSSHVPVVTVPVDAVGVAVTEDDAPTTAPR